MRKKIVIIIVLFCLSLFFCLGTIKMDVNMIINFMKNTGEMHLKSLEKNYTITVSYSNLDNPYRSVDKFFIEVKTSLLNYAILKAKLYHYSEDVITVIYTWQQNTIFDPDPYNKLYH